MFNIILSSLLVTQTLVALSRVTAEQREFMGKVLIFSTICVFFELVFCKLLFNKNKLFFEIGFLGCVACAIGPEDNLLVISLCLMESYFACAYILGDEAVAEADIRGAVGASPPPPPPIAPIATVSVPLAADVPANQPQNLTLQRQLGVYVERRPSHF